MRKAKIVNIDGLGEVTVKEISPFAIYKALSAENKVQEISTLFLESVSLSKEKMQGLYASEIEQLVDAYIEVNSSFLAITGKLKLEAVIVTMMTEVLNKLSTVLPGVFVDSYKKVMEKMPGIMVGAAS